MDLGEGCCLLGYVSITQSLKLLFELFCIGREETFGKRRILILPGG